MKRVLVISYYWPPSGGSGVQRWVKMCKYLPSFGWQAVVYTPSNPAVDLHDESLLKDTEGIEVLHNSILEPGQFVRKTTSSQVNPINAGKKSFRQKLALWLRANLFIPDPRRVWVEPSVRFLKSYLKDHPVDAVVSTGPPHSMHLIAQKISAKFSIPWIADFRDPWTGMFYFKHLPLLDFARRKHFAMEKSVLDGADRVVAVSPLVKDDFCAMTSTPIHLVTNGYDEEDFPEKTGNPAQDWRFTIVHAGLFAADGNPDALWKAIADLTDENPAFASVLDIILCGKTDAAVMESIRANRLARYTKNLGYLPHDRTVKLMSNSSILILPLRKEPEYRATVPGKLFEYLAARRPVIAIGQKDGAMARILESANAGETFEWNEGEKMKEALSKLFAQYMEGKLNDNESDISKYSRKSLACEMARILDSLTK